MGPEDDPLALASNRELERSDVEALRLLDQGEGSSLSPRREMPTCCHSPSLARTSTKCPTR